jgi:hypothetical protein
MNLLQRIKPEVLASINVDEKNYPHLIARLKNELSEEIYSPLNLRLNTAYTLCLYANVELGMNSVYNLFNDDTENEKI